MPLDVSISTLLHLLVFAYWLGGDAGVFYSSFVVTDPRRSAEARITAAKILLNVDMVPRVCLLLTAPTGLALANAKGWLSLHPSWIVAVFAIALAWIGLAFAIHIKQGAKILIQIDLVARMIFLATLLSLGIGGAAGLFNIPLFVSFKLIALGVALLMGILVRLILRPFGPAFATLATGSATPETDAAISKSIGGTRPAVITIWVMLTIAAYLGVAVPT